MLSENEIEMMRMISENDNPEMAILTAINVFAAFLEQLEADQELQAAGPQGSF